MLFGKRMKTKAEAIAMIEEKPSQKETHTTKRRKPQDRSRLTRNSQVQIRLTKEEVSVLKTAARENDMSLADFVMSGVHQTRRIVVPGAAELRSGIIRTGNNLNQAVRLAHTLKREGRVIDAVSIELSADRVVDILDELHSWLTKWDVDLTYKTKIEKE